MPALDRESDTLFPLGAPAQLRITTGFSAQGHAKVAGTTGTFSYALRRTCTEIATEDYVAFRDRVRDTAAKLRDAISFAPKKPRR